jgi:hypothetical protein
MCAMQATPLQTKASGGEAWPIAYQQFYLQQYYPNQKWYQYQFEPNSPFYGNYYNQDEAEMPNANAKAWRNFLRIDNSINDSSILKYLSDNCEPNQATNNSLDKYFVDENKQYLSLLKQYHTEAVAQGGTWDYQTYTGGKRKEDLQKVINSATKLLQGAASNFIKWRALHVMLRTYHNNGHYVESKQIFDKYYPQINKDSSLTQFWCEGLYAGTNLRLKNYDQSNYWCARSWMNINDDVSGLATTYKWGNRDWLGAMKLCKTTADSIAVITLHSATDVEPSIGLIEKLFRLSPSSDVLRLLWMRETQKMQHLYEADEYSFWSFGEERQNKLMATYKKPNVFQKYFMLGDVLIDNSTGDLRAMVANSLGFILLHKNKVLDSKKYIDIAATSAQNKVDIAQHKVLQYQYQIRTNNNVSEDEIATMLQEIKSFETPENKDLSSYFSGYVVGPYLVKQNKLALAALAFVHANDNGYYTPYQEGPFEETGLPYLEYWYGDYLMKHKLSYEQLGSLQTKLDNKKGDSKLETMLLNAKTLVDYKNIFSYHMCKRYALEERWQDALNILPKLSKKFADMATPNPVNFKVDDFIGLDSSKQTMTTQKIFVLANKLKISADGGNARDQYLYGNLLYNMSMYGTNHNIIDDHWNYYMDQTPYFLWDSIEVEFNTFNVAKNAAAMSPAYKNYFRMYNAIKYYKMAQGKLNNKETEAECLFMQAKCWQRQCPIKADYVKHAINNPYFLQLKTKFAQTAITAEITSDCSYYRKYLSKK